MGRTVQCYLLHTLGKSKINFTEEKLIELLKDSSITLTSKFDVQLLADIDVLGISFEG